MFTNYQSEGENYFVESISKLKMGDVLKWRQ